MKKLALNPYLSSVGLAIA